jgi:putative endonuclease
LTDRKQLHDGTWAEAEAEEFLRGHGLSVLTRNFRCRRGEIDLIMLDGDVLVFVEVRYRRSRRFGTGAESITYGKRRRLLAAAGFFLSRGGIDPAGVCRFDVVSVSGRNYRPEFQWIRNAFTQDGW